MLGVWDLLKETIGLLPQGRGPDTRRGYCLLHGDIDRPGSCSSVHQSADLIARLLRGNEIMQSAWQISGVALILMVLAWRSNSLGSRCRLRATKPRRDAQCLSVCHSFSAAQRRKDATDGLIDVEMGPP